MADTKHAKDRNPTRAQKISNWGGKLFFGVLFAVLAFFWWLLIYSGGVVERHG
jgi:hypothetical protein